MAEPKSSAPMSGVTHVRTRHTANFTVLSNRLTQRSGSAVTVGVAAYILSLPDGVSIRVDALCAHFHEGRDLIARALRELEEEGWLERRVERGPGGRIVTRTFVYDVPGAGAGPVPAPVPVPVPAPVPAPVPHERRPDEPVRVRGRVRNEPAPAPVEPASEPTAPEPAPYEPAAAPEPAPYEPAAAPKPAPPPTPVAAEPTSAATAEPSDPRATAVLGALRHRDRRLLLSAREMTELAPAVTAWLDRGVGPHRIAEALAADLPATLTRRPARLIAYRLEHHLPALPTPAPERPPVVPLRNCGGCDRAFRSEWAERCRDCRSAQPGTGQSAEPLAA
ncbi:hypothetical protein [Streptomyces sp. H27-D2]|uniref:hypothetical protein n=1 Tax=Streptomyces sp. H27-D2 TaxID=3046304 RepID=UPI002DBD72AC|nr:hypothetical protein [Streptomyces sp. H27-D2]MEC4016252.1 hypothetical protein [Streptomyces sp. H27-D2]